MTLFYIALAASYAAEVMRFILTKEFDRATGLSALFGVDTLNRPLVVDITSLPHTLIGGTTGGGKSVLLNSIAVSLLFKHTPETLQFIIIDPKQVEFSGFAGLPHLLRPVVTDPYLAIDTLASVCDMIDQRYKRMAARKVKNAAEMGLPSVVVMIDELADLIILGKKPVETAIVRIAQLGRAAGVHLIVATQQPTVNVVTGLIKANISCRIALPGVKWCASTKAARSTAYWARHRAICSSLLYSLF